MIKLTIQTTSQSSGHYKYPYDTKTLDLMVTEAPTYNKVNKVKGKISGAGFYCAVKAVANHATFNRDESEAIGTAQSDVYINPTATPKSSYQLAEITGQAQARGGDLEGAFVEIIKDITQDGAEQFARDRNRAIFRQGNSVLAKTSATSTDSTTVTCDNDEGVFHLAEGMVVDILDTTYPTVTGGGINVNGVAISTIDRSANTFVMASAATTDEAIEDIVMGGNRDTTMNKDILGFDAFMDDGTNAATYLGITKATYDKFKGNYITASNVAITHKKLQQAYNELRKDSGVGLKTKNLEILVNDGQEFQCADIVMPTQRTNDKTEYTIGYTYLNFRGIPIVTDPQCPRGSLYFTDFNSFDRHCLLDATWGNLGGQMWFSHHGLGTNYDKFTAMLKQYEEVICKQPNRNARIHSAAEPSW